MWAQVNWDPGGTGAPVWQSVCSNCGRESRWAPPQVLARLDLQVSEPGAVVSHYRGREATSCNSRGGSSARAKVGLVVSITRSAKRGPFNPLGARGPGQENLPTGSRLATLWASASRHRLDVTGGWVHSLCLLQGQRQRLRDKLEQIDAGLGKRPQRCDKVQRRIGRWLGRNTMVERIFSVEVRTEPP